MGGSRSTRVGADRSPPAGNASASGAGAAVAMPTKRVVRMICGNCMLSGSFLEMVRWLSSIYGCGCKSNKVMSEADQEMT